MTCREDTSLYPSIFSIINILNDHNKCEYLTNPELYMMFYLNAYECMYLCTYAVITQIAWYNWVKLLEMIYVWSI